MNPLEMMSEIYEFQLEIYGDEDMAATATVMIINQMLDEPPASAGR